METSESLSKPTIALHWVVAILFIAVLAFGLYIEELPKGPEKGELMGLHKSFGFLVLLIASIRLTWRLYEGQLSPVPGAPQWQEKVAKGVHHLLLLATLLMPLSGIAMSVGGGRGLDVFGVSLIAAGEKIGWLQEAGSETHEVLANIVIAVLVLHIAGAVKHHLIDRDNTLKRMLGRS